MALKPTIFKFVLNLADLDRSRFEELSVTVAQHPSETIERMMVRVAAYCLNYEPELTFTRGLSENDEPDLWAHHLDGRISHWIEVGEPSPERLRKAARGADALSVYAFNSRVPVWWRQNSEALAASGASIWQIDWPDAVKLGALAERTATFTITLSRPSVFIASDRGEVELGLIALAEP
ncbi:MAG: YaeQ family protein [Pseudomonadota bacterium]